MTVLVTGSNGLLGRALKKVLGDGHVYHTREDVDLTNYQESEVSIMEWKTFNDCIESIRDYKKKIKLIHISTDEVYGDIKKNHKSKEDDSYNPSSPYSASKASGDLLIKSYIRTYKIPAIITNCCNNFGPNQYPEKLIPTIITTY